MLFSKVLIEKILLGTKTSTMRNKVQVNAGKITNLMADRDYSKISGKYIKITKVYPIKLKDVDDTKAQKDGFKNVEELKDYWLKKIGAWNPNQVIYIHEFEVVEHI